MNEALHDSQKNAFISECGEYRYWLSREFSKVDKTLLWIMLNPSTADHTVDDPTIRRCCSFASQWGYGSIIVANLYALRSPSPKDLWAHEDPVGEHNNEYLKECMSHSFVTVCAWGNNARQDRVDEFKELAGDTPLYCLGTTQSGMPKHPLYIKSDQTLEPYII